MFGFRKKILALLLTFACILTSLPTCIFAVDDYETNLVKVDLSRNEITTSSIYNIEYDKFIGDGYEVEFKVTNKWKGNFNGELIISNTGKEAIENWTLRFDFDHKINNIWNGKILAYQGSKYTIKNLGWNQDIAPNSSVTIGFIAEWNKNILAPRNYGLLNSEQEASQSDYSIGFKVVSDWGTGFNGEISITNIGQDAIEDWTLEFDFDRKIDRFWVADIIKQESNHYVIKNKGYNANIAPGQTITLGFGGTPGNVVKQPVNYKLKKRNQAFILNIDQPVIDNVYIVSSDYVELSGQAEHLSGIAEVSYSITSEINTDIKIGYAVGTTNWNIKDIPVQVGMNYIDIIAKSNDGSVMKKSFVIDRMSTEIEMANNIFVADDNDVADILNGFKGYWTDDNNTPDNYADDKIALLIEEESPLVIGLKEGLFGIGDIYFIQPNDDLPMGFTKFICGYEELSQNKTYNDLNSDLRELYPLEEYPDELYEVVYTQNPGLTDLFKGDMRIKINAIDQENPIAFSTFGTDVEISYTTESVIQIENFERSNLARSFTLATSTASANRPGIQYDNLTKMFKPSLNQSGNSVKLKFIDTVIYDKDGNAGTKNDQIKLGGEIGLEDIKIDSELDWKPSIGDMLPQWVKYDLSYKEIVKLKAAFEGEFSLADFMKGNNTFGKFDNEREFDYSVLGLMNVNATVSGVDMNDTIILGCVGIKTMPMAPAVGNIQSLSGQTKTVPLRPILVIMVTLDVKGELKCELGVTYEYSQNFRKGFEFQKIDPSKPRTGARTYDIGLDRRLTLIDENSAPQHSLYIEGKGSAETAVCPGFKMGLMTAGIMPAMVSAGVSIENKAEVDGRITLLPEIGVEGAASVESNILAKIAADLRLKVEYDGDDVGTLSQSYDLSYPIYHKKYSFEGNKLEGIVYDGIESKTDAEGISNKKSASTWINKPLPGASIVIEGGGIRKTATSDLKGAYKISGIPNGKYIVTYSKKGYDMRKTDINVSQNDTEIYATINRGQYKLTGQVKDENNNPVAGARVIITARESGVNSPPTQITDVAGNFKLDTLKAGVYRIDISKPGYISSIKEIEVRSSTNLSLNIFEEGTAKIHGRVVQADEDIDLTNNIGLSGVTISLTGIGNISTIKQSTVTNSEGKYFLQGLPVGTYLLNITKVGYITIEDYVTIDSADTIVYNLALEMISTQYKTRGVAKGTVKDAVSGRPVANGFTIYVRKGINNKTGEILKTIQTDKDGMYLLDMAGGNYTLQILDYRNVPSGVTRYAPGIINVKILGGRTIYNQDGTIIPRLNTGEIRIVLRWGAEPRDLDAHLIGPSDNAGNKFHVFYQSKEHRNTSGMLMANLDVDDTTSYGPETTTIYHQIKADTNYSFYVHDYTNKNSNSSLALSKSGAIVEVYTSNSQTPKVFSVPGNPGNGTLWKVFEFDANTQQIIPINLMKYQSSPGDVGYISRSMAITTNTQEEVEEIKMILDAVKGEKVISEAEGDM